MNNITYSAVSQPSNGSLELNSATGTYVYTHNGSGTTTDSFNFVVTNGTLTSSIQTAQIVIIPTDMDGFIGISQIVQFLNSGQSSSQDINGDGVYNQDDTAFLLSLISPFNIVE